MIPCMLLPQTRWPFVRNPLWILVPSKMAPSITLHLILFKKRLATTLFPEEQIFHTHWIPSISPTSMVMIREIIFRDAPPTVIAEIREKITKCVRRIQQLYTKTFANLQQSCECCLKRNGWGGGHIDNVLV